MNAVLIGMGAAMALAGNAVGAEPVSSAPLVRIAELEIDRAQIDAYKTLLAEEQEASVRLEPGVLMLHSVAIAEAPNQVRLLEVYASRGAYEAHIASPHFVKYKAATEKMVRALRLIETKPILLCAKSKGREGGPVTCI